MEEPDHSPSGLLDQAKAIGSTSLAAFENRAELFILELEEERARLMELTVWALAAGFLGMMFCALLTLFVVWLSPDNAKPWVLGGFCVLYLGGAIFAFLNLKSVLKDAPSPFAGSIKEMKKDVEWLESSK